MCGIVGYVGDKNAVPILIQGLEHLEYRGYDSAGIACLEEKSGRMLVIKEKGKLAELKKLLAKKPVTSHVGIGHTRWATHGEPSRANAHPHTDSENRVVIVHNGIIENYVELKRELEKKGIRFRSQTDTEVAANLIGSYYKKGQLLAGFLKAVKRLNGFFAFVAFAEDDPETVIAFKRSNPLVIGLGEKQNFIASDVSAILAHTNKVIFLEDNEYALVRSSEVRVFSLITGKQIFKKATVIKWSVSQARKNGFAHFMMKEIHEQPRVIEEALTKRVDANNRVRFDTLRPSFMSKLKTIRKAYLVSCGTAYHAGMVGGKLIEDLARIPATVTVSSEFRYGNPVLGKDDLVILITQSGETADTLAALREAKIRGAHTLAIVNVVGSTIAREADAVIYTHAGPEIGVASTKAYTAQLITLILFTLLWGSFTNKANASRLKDLIRQTKKLPEWLETILSRRRVYEQAAKKFYRCGNFLYLGRGYNFPTALEGALKLKEISYAHAHGYAAGEMKHGPIALIDDKQPVICIAPSTSKTYEKMISNIEEIKARRGRILSIGNNNDEKLKKLSEHFFNLPAAPEELSPILTTVPLQLFAYYVAVLNGRDVDHPRNLAKSVTVE